MFDPLSPFHNLPSNLDRRQAFYFDGIRHAFEIIECAFSRLTKSLVSLTHDFSEKNRPNNYAHYYLDAWAFVDAVDRLLALWKLQPNSGEIPHPWTPKKLINDLQEIRNIRNVSDHLAQRADQVISSNTAALGELSWVTVFSYDPPTMKSCLIRPGFLPRTVAVQMNIPKERMNVTNSAGNVCLKAHTYTANLSDAYATILDLAAFAENNLKTAFGSRSFAAPIGGDAFATCELDFSGHKNTNPLTQR